MQRTKTLATEPTHASHNCLIANATLPIKSGDGRQAKSRALSKARD